MRGGIQKGQYKEDKCQESGVVVKKWNGNFLKGKNYQKVKVIEKYSNIVFRINCYVICGSFFRYI